VRFRLAQSSHHASSQRPHHQSGDQLSVELVEPTDHPAAIRILWPAKTTIVPPAKFNAVAAEIMRLLASAVTAYNQYKARRL
jgi:hypothetical protein